MSHKGIAPRIFRPHGSPSGFSFILIAKQNSLLTIIFESSIIPTIRK